MNFIAHLYLSKEQEQILVGNFIADSIKGKQIELLPQAIKSGVLLHRHIDFFTDNHPIVKESKHLIVEKYNHFSGVLVDIFFDYFLVKNWNQFSPISIQEFSKNSIDALEQNHESLTFDTAHFLAYIKKYNIIERYNSIEAIHFVLQGMSKRTTIANSGIENGYQELQIFENQFENYFMDFFPELIKSCDEFWIKNQL